MLVNIGLPTFCIILYMLLTNMIRDNSNTGIFIVYLKSDVHDLSNDLTEIENR